MRNKSYNLKVSCLALKLSFPNRLKLGVKSKVKMLYIWVMNDFIAYLGVIILDIWRYICIIEIYAHDSYN